MKTLILIILVVSQKLALAGLFGPSNFEDCVLEGMKGVQSDAAAYAINRACRQKFPQKEATPSKQNTTRSGFPRVDIWEKPYNYKIFNNIKVGTSAYNQYNAFEIPITNMTNITIAGVFLGIPANKSSNQCLLDKSDYSEIYECSVNIFSNTTKKAYCGMPKVSFCLVGIKAAYESDVDKFFRDIAP